MVEQSVFWPILALGIATDLLADRPRLAEMRYFVVLQWLLVAGVAQIGVSGFSGDPSRIIVAAFVASSAGRVIGAEYGRWQDRQEKDRDSAELRALAEQYLAGGDHGTTA
jgi:hypothetical protein